MTNGQSRITRGQREPGPRAVALSAKTGEGDAELGAHSKPKASVEQPSRSRKFRRRGVSQQHTPSG